MAGFDSILSRNATSWRHAQLIECFSANMPRTHSSHARLQAGERGSERNCDQMVSIPRLLSNRVRLRYSRPASHLSRNGPVIQRLIGKVKPFFACIANSPGNASGNAPRNRCLARAPLGKRMLAGIANAISITRVSRNGIRNSSECAMLFASPSRSSMFPR